MIGKSKGNGKVALLCDDCGTEIFVDENMVMLHDYLWDWVCNGKIEEAYCDECIEKRLNRKITVQDLTHAPCNYMWVQNHFGEDVLIKWIQSSLHTST